MDPIDQPDFSVNCRLCFEHSSESIDIFSQKGIHLEVASILAKHFTFLQVNKLYAKLNIFNRTNRIFTPEFFPDKSINWRHNFNMLEMFNNCS